MRRSIFILGCVFLLGCNQSVDPNFIVFLVDDLGWADVGCNNPETFYETPNVDHLASNGIRFTDAYASCPVCSPTRASIMTGKAPARLNITDWIPGSNPKNRKLLGPDDLHNLPSDELTIAEKLTQHGYTTCHVGKWHIGQEGSWPEDHGFDINIGGWSKGSPAGGYYSPYKNPRLPDGPEGEFLTRRLTDEAMLVIDSLQNQPFFMYFAFYTVHTPIQASIYHHDYFKEKLASMPPSTKPQQRVEHDGITKLVQDNTAYASMVAAMDETVGRIVQQIKDLGLYHETYFFFTSDNGGLSTLKNRGYPTANLPLRAGKGWAYEGGIRVPFILSGPDIDPTISSTLVTSMDIYPTLLSLAKIPLLPDQHIDGKDILSVQSQTDTPTLYWHYPHYHGSTWTPGAAIRSGSWKLIEFYDYEKVELYNLAMDIGETVNLTDSFPDKQKELLELLHSWQQEVNAQMPTPNRRILSGSGD